MVRVEIGSLIAEVDALVWKSVNADMEDALNLSIDDARYSPADPFPDLHAAEDAVALFGGRIVDVKGEKESKRGRIY